MIPNGKFCTQMHNNKKKYEAVNIKCSFYCTKGQMKSECIYEIIDFPKYHHQI